MNKKTLKEYYFTYGILLERMSQAWEKSKKADDNFSFIFSTKFAQSLKLKHYDAIMRDVVDILFHSASEEEWAKAINVQITGNKIVNLSYICQGRPR